MAARTFDGYFKCMGAHGWRLSLLVGTATSLGCLAPNPQWDRDIEPSFAPSSSTGDDEDAMGDGSTTDDSTANGSTTDGSTTDDSDTATTGQGMSPELVLWLDFEEDPLETSGALDKSEYGALAMCTANFCPTPVAGRIGSAAQFDGVDDFLSIPDAAHLRLSAGTLAAWVELGSDPPGNRTIVGKALDAAANSFELLRTGGRTCGFKTQTAVDGGVLVAGVALETGRWTHLAGVWNGTEMVLYVDGVEVTREPASAPDYDGSPVTVGADINHETVDQPFPGKIDELRLYARALTAAEVAELADPD